LAELEGSQKTAEPAATVDSVADRKVDSPSSELRSSLAAASPCPPPTAATPASTQPTPFKAAMHDPSLASPQNSEKLNSPCLTIPEHSAAHPIEACPRSLHSPLSSSPRSPPASPTSLACASEPAVSSSAATLVFPASDPSTSAPAPASAPPVPAAASTAPLPLLSPLLEAQPQPKPRWADMCSDDSEPDDEQIPPPRKPPVLAPCSRCERLLPRAGFSRRAWKQVRGLGSASGEPSPAACAECAAPSAKAQAATPRQLRPQQHHYRHRPVLG